MKQTIVILGLWMLAALWADKASHIAKNHNYFVRIEIKLAENKQKKKQKDSFSLNDYDDYIKYKKTLIVPGIIFDKNLIITKEIQVVPSQYTSITIVTAENKRLSASYYGKLLHHSIDVFQANVKLLPPKLVSYDIVKKSAETHFLLKLINKENKLFFLLNKSANIQRFPFDKSYKDMPADSYTDNIALMLTKKGKPFGYYTGRYGIEKGKPSWIVAPAKARLITANHIAKANKQIVSQLANSIYKAVIQFRPMLQKKDDFSFSSDEKRIKDSTIEIKTSACLVNQKGNLLIPVNIPKKHIKRITKITLGKNKYPAEFKGSYKNIGGLMIYCPKLKGIKPNFVIDHLPVRGELFYSVAFDYNSLEASAEVMPTRYHAIKRGYQDQRILDIFPEPTLFDTFFINYNYQIIGFYGEIKKDEEDKIRSKNRFYSKSDSNKFFSFTEIKNYLKTPSLFFDATAKPQEKKRAKTNLWLGVDIQFVKKSMLEYLQATEITQNGKRGYFISRVYKNSPAAIIGLISMDILISITPIDTKTEIFLENDEYRYQRFSYDDWWARDRDYKLPFQRFFTERKSDLTDVLKELGENREVEIKYFRNGKIKKAILKLQKAPVSFDTAPKAIEDRLGIVVKDLTYEVREVLKLASNAPGVIISRVDSGKPANIAKLKRYEIIELLDGVAIKNTKQFQKLIATARVKGQKEITLLIARLDKKRIVRLILPR